MATFFAESAAVEIASKKQLIHTLFFKENF